MGILSTGALLTVCFSTSDISYQLCFCCQKLEICEIFESGSGADREQIHSLSHMISLIQSEAQNREGIGRGLGGDRGGLGADPLPKSCDLSEPIRSSD